MCECIAEINALLARHNTAITANPIGPARACIGTHRLDAGRDFDPPKLMAAYCPFCGDSYDAKARPIPFHREGAPGDLIGEQMTF